MRRKLRAVVLQPKALYSLGITVLRDSDKLHEQRPKGA